MSLLPLIIIIGIILILSFFLLGLIKAFRIKNNTSDSTPLSIVIALKNEEHIVEKLLNSLKNIEYDEKLFEVIFVDDLSTDKTVEKIQNSIKPNYRIISAKAKKYTGKKGALDCGIKSAQFEHLVITDADCVPEKKWLQYLSASFNYGNDIVFGISPLTNSKKIASKFSSFDNFRVFLQYLSGYGLNLTYGATARNFAFTKKFYVAVEGFKDIDATLSGDDDLLIKKAITGKYKIGAFTSSEGFVYSKAPDSFHDFFNRRSRHLKTSHKYLFKHILMLGIWHLTNITALFSVALIPLSISFVYPFLLKALFDTSINLYYQKKFKQSYSLAELFVFQVLFELFVIFNFFNSLIKKDKWK